MPALLTNQTSTKTHARTRSAIPRAIKGSLSRPDEYGLKGSAVGATNALEAHLLHEVGNQRGRNRKVGRLRRRYEDVPRTVGGDELEGHIVETSAPAPNLPKVAHAIGPATLTILLDLHGAGHRRYSVVTQ